MSPSNTGMLWAAGRKTCPLASWSPLFCCWLGPADFTVLEVTPRDQGSEVSSAAMIHCILESVAKVTLILRVLRLHVFDTGTPRGPCLPRCLMMMSLFVLTFVGSRTCALRGVGLGFKIGIPQRGIPPQITNSCTAAGQMQ